MNNRALKNGQALELTVSEFKLLSLLMQNPNITLTRTGILDKLWDGDGDFIDDNTLSVYVRRLRRKIEDNPDHPQILLTVRGIGYKWNVVK
jgi:DNA-binding response OmpR family regulator